MPCNCQDVGSTMAVNGSDPCRLSFAAQPARQAHVKSRQLDARAVVDAAVQRHGQHQAQTR